MKKKSALLTKRVLPVLCTFAILVSGFQMFALGASAAAVTSKYDCDRTVTFTVKTKSSGTPSLKFTCDAAPKSAGHRCSKAPVMAITVSPAVNGKTFFLVKDSFDMTPRNISSTLKLQKNKTYKITVSYYVNKTNKCTSNDLCYVNAHDLTGNVRYGRYRDPYVNGTWYIAQAKNCTVSSFRYK